MKTTGVVRRIDDLGRIVIPKEIRRSLRIKDGESLEIFVEDEIIALKKYSSMNDLSDICMNLTNTINQTISKNILITNRDNVLAYSGNNKNNYLKKSISKFVEEKLKNREVTIEKDKRNVEFIEKLTTNSSYVISPIISNGDVVGSVIIFSEIESITDIDEKISALAANFLGRHIEE